MKERPFLCSGPMVRAILDGRKTVTRRAIKPAPEMVTVSSITPWDGDPSALMRLLEQTGRRCPLGQPGDRLWVRETFRDARTAAAARVLYKATGDVACGWKPSIHMPRWACRILLEVTAVRVERLQDITEEQAQAEGVRPIEGMKWHTFEEAAAAIPMRDHTALDAFEALWERINGDGSWAANPWVWVIEFKPVSAGELA